MAPSAIYLLTSLLLSLTTLPGAESRPLKKRAAYSIPSGYTKVLFSEDFSMYPDLSRPRSDVWTYDTGFNYPGGPWAWGTGEIQNYTTSLANARTKNGVLEMQALKTPQGWTSTRIETKPQFDVVCMPGKKLRLESTLWLGANSVQNQQGIWPAFWALSTAFRGNYNNWPLVGELDMMERVNGVDKVWQTMHCGNTMNGGPCHETTGLSSGGFYVEPGKFHTYAVEIDRTNTDWQAQKIVFSIDGVTTLTITGQTVGDMVAWTNVAHTPKFFLLNIAVGGSFPDGVAGFKTPNSNTLGEMGSGMLVSYVAAFGN
jgi:hypothetical protein